MRCLSLAIFVFAMFCLVLDSQAETQPDANSQSPGFRVAIVGLVHGHVSGFFAHSLRRPDIQIVGIFEPDRQIFSRYQSQFQLDQALLFTNLEEMLQQTRPQAVLVYTNTLDHRKVIEVCARRGIHVMVEKPLTVSMEDARAIAHAAKQGGIHVLVNYETTWYSSNHAAYDLVHENSIGDIRKVVIHDGHRGPKEIGVQPEFLAWLTDPKLNGGGALFDFGCYGADLMTWLMDGQRPETVTAITQRLKPDVYPHVDDEATIVLAYPKAQAIIQASWNWPFDRKDMEVYGQSGSIMTVRRDEVRVRVEGDQQEKQVAAPPVAAPYDDSVSELRAVIQQGAKPDGLTSLETNVTVTEILDAARRSAATGSTVR